MGQESTYRGVTYGVEAVPVGQDAWHGRFHLLDGSASGDVDALHPSMDTVWGSENEALTYATEAACHAIEILQTGRPQGQGHGSPSSERRFNNLGQ
jgi:hypothetical protein